MWSRTRSNSKQPSQGPPLHGERVKMRTSPLTARALRRPETIFRKDISVVWSAHTLQNNELHPLWSLLYARVTRISRGAVTYVDHCNAPCVPECMLFEKGHDRRDAEDDDVRGGVPFSLKSRGCPFSILRGSTYFLESEIALEQMRGQQFA